MDIRVRDRYFWAQYEILEIPEINGSDLLVYMVLARFANNETQTCYPSYKKICEFGHLTRPTVAKSIKHLEELGLITIRRAVKRNNYYTLVNISSKNIELVKNNRNLVKNSNANYANLTKLSSSTTAKKNFTVPLEECSPRVRKICSELNIEPVPTLIDFVDGIDFVDYSVNYSIKLIKEWMEPKGLTTISSNRLIKWLRDDLESGNVKRRDDI